MMSLAFSFCVIVGAAADAFRNDIEPWVARRVRQMWFEDIDCDFVRSAFIDWNELRKRIVEFDRSWAPRGAPPIGICNAILEDRNSDIGIVLEQPQEASEECSLGALAASILGLICTSNCGTGDAADLLAKLWLRLHTPANDTKAHVGRHGTRLSHWRPRPAYLLATSAWPLASLFTKWSLNCTSRTPLQNQRRRNVCRPAAQAFVRDAGSIAVRTLLPLLEGPGNAQQMIFDSRLDIFAMEALPHLHRLNQLLPRESPEWRRSECIIEKATLEGMLLFLRIMGPNVAPERDPLSSPRIERLGVMLSDAPLSTLLRHGWLLFAILTSLRLTTWRSHRLYPGAQVNPDDLYRLLNVGAMELQNRASESLPNWRGVGLTEALRAAPVVRHNLWQRVADSAESGYFTIGQPAGAVSRRIASWLLEAPSHVPAVVYLTMFWGDMGHRRWVSSFLKRALQVGVPRFLFMSPNEPWLRDCEDVSKEQRLGGSYRRLLCVRSFAPFARPYDVNNYAKFVLLPLLISLGVDYAWLDVDIFLIRDPTNRLLELAYGPEHVSKGRKAGADVLTTDHFDETCLNHGVIFVKASDRALLWALSYQQWMHEYPFGHDQNGWDAFLAHSIQNEPMVPLQPNVSLLVLDTSLEFLTLTGWAGTESDFSKAQLLHMTRTTPIVLKEKRERLFLLFDAAEYAGKGEAISARPEDVAVREMLLGISTPAPLQKRPCYEGVHVSVEGMVNDGTYWNLFD